MKTETEITKTAGTIVAALDTLRLVEMFEATDVEMAGTITHEHRQELVTVRGWVMDELVKRDADAFDAWLDANVDSPRAFYTGGSK